ncbi:MAG: ABC transporter permease subunit, partial [Acetatifactor sp.]|nr:ABC transporter permease subunit [Acetatifactor sp.]
ALTSIDPELYEAARIDGANKVRLIRHIEIPQIMPTIVIMLIMSVGRFMSIGFQKAFLLQNTMNLQKSEIISTYIYRIGMLSQQFDFSTAVGLFNNIVNVILLVIVNTISKKLNETSLF